MNLPEAKAQTIFGEALALIEPAERAAFLEQACRGDEALRLEVESLLASFQDAGDFLSNGVCSTQVPLTCGVGLICCPNLYPAMMEKIKIICIRNMAVERDRIKLGHHGYMIDAGVNTIAQGNIYQTIFST